jgi:hypothetical protein
MPPHSIRRIPAWLICLPNPLSFDDPSSLE